MGVRRQAREAALQALFSCDSLGSWDSSTIGICFDHFGINDPVRSYAETLGRGVIEHLSEIESKITCASDHWSLSRMAKVDRCILRLATYEILCTDDIPIGVAIDEAIEIAKRFGTENSSTFVNGVLDRVATSINKQIEVIKVVKPKAEPDSVLLDSSLDSGELAELGDDAEIDKKSDSWRLL